MKIIFSLILAACLSLFILEIKGDPVTKVYSAAFSKCDLEFNQIFANRYFAVDYILGKYWNIRDLQVSEAYDQSRLVEALFVLSSKYGSACQKAVFSKLNELEAGGYKFADYRYENGFTLIQGAVLLGDFNAVIWLLENYGFVNSTITKESSPYFDFDIFKLSKKLSEERPSGDRAKIYEALVSYEKNI